MPAVAAVAGAFLAASFAAPAVVTAVGVTSAFASAAITVAVGAAGGALGSKLAGGSLGQGALIGGGVGLGVGLFGGVAGSAGAATGATTAGPAGAAGLAKGTATGLATNVGAGAAATGATTAAPAAASALAKGAATGLAANVGSGAAAAGSAGLGASLGSKLTTAIGGLVSDPGTLAQVTMMAVNGLSSGDAQTDRLVQQRAQELQALAQQNRQLFDTQVAEARNFMRRADQAAPNPSQAFAETKIATERQLADDTRGMNAERARYASRQAAIRSTQTGATAATQEEARGQRAVTELTNAGLAALPSGAPDFAGGAELELYEGLANRKRQQQNELAYGGTRVLSGLFG